MKTYTKLIIAAVAFLTVITAAPVLNSSGAVTGVRLCQANSPGMEQTAGTSQGTVRRYTDISSPYSGAYLYQDITVEGSSEITESFSMGNVPSARKNDSWLFDSIFPAQKSGPDSENGPGSGNPAGSALSGSNNPDSGATDNSPLEGSASAAPAPALSESDPQPEFKPYLDEYPFLAALSSLDWQYMF